jgi:hypothetical protein
MGPKCAPRACEIHGCTNVNIKMEHYFSVGVSVRCVSASGVRVGHAGGSGCVHFGALTQACHAYRMDHTRDSFRRNLDRVEPLASRWGDGFV